MNGYIMAYSEKYNFILSQFAVPSADSILLQNFTVNIKVSSGSFAGGDGTVLIYLYRVFVGGICQMVKGSGVKLRYYGVVEGAVQVYMNLLAAVGRHVYVLGFTVMPQLHH